MAAEYLAPLVVIVGETASGKSSLAIELAERFDGEIIAADSRTIYEGMDIGTAKPTLKEQQQVPHYLLDVVQPDQTYNAAQFKQDALAQIDDIWWHGKLPIMVGGTGLYVDSVIFDYQFTGSKAKRDPQNPRHLLKETTPKNSSIKLQQLRPNTLVIGLKLEKNILEQRIKLRVEHMLKNGLVNEAKALLDQYGPDNVALKGIGYKSLVQHLYGQISLEEAKQQAIRDHMQLAKRQRTWFKRNKYIHWIDDPNEAKPLLQTFLSQFEY